MKALSAGEYQRLGVPGLTQIVVREPNDSRAHFYLGLALADAREFGKAAGHFARAHKLRPSWGDPPYYLGRALLDSGRPAEALDALKSAIRLTPTESPWPYLGRAHRRLGHDGEAVDAFECALEERARETWIHTELADLSSKPGVEIPRPETPLKILHDVRLQYPGYHRKMAECRFRLLNSTGGKIALATRDEQSYGTSITNVAEQVATIASQRFDFDLMVVPWFEHYETSVGNHPSLTRVSFTGSGDDLTAHFRPADFATFEELTGLRLLWTADHFKLDDAPK